MLILNPAEFSAKHFLAHYWQQRPLVIRQAFLSFADPLSPDELAGLACEEAIESRLIYRKDGQWQAETGPFTSYEHLGEQDWTLVVQAVDHWVPEVTAMARAFSFLPKWRFDDVMVSYATPGGGVGPHIDLYDVFICQGSGKRRWRVGEKGPHRQFAAHTALLHTDSFEPIIDVELLPGDILYIPPGFPHDGVTLEHSLSFSVGYRSKSTSDVFSSLADYLIDQELGQELFSDPRRSMSHHQGHIEADDVAVMIAQLQATLNNTALMTDVLGSLLSKTKCALDLQALEEPYSEEELVAALEEQSLTRTGGLRCFYLDASLPLGVCYVDGEKWEFGAACKGVVQALCDRDELNAELLRQGLRQPVFVRALTSWVNAGYWYF